MGRVYEQAEGVHIWLGPEDDETEEAVSWFRDNPSMNITLDSEDGSTRPRWADLIRRFCDQPWFSWRWVIQEARLARKAVFHRGRHTISFNDIDSGFYGLTSVLYSTYQIRMLSVLRAQGKTSLLELLWNFHAADCSDPRDRIAALFGLVLAYKRFKMDYSMDWTTLHRQTALSVLTAGDEDEMLQLYYTALNSAPWALLMTPPIPPGSSTGPRLDRRHRCLVDTTRGFRGFSPSQISNTTTRR